MSQQLQQSTQPQIPAVWANFAALLGVSPGEAKQVLEVQIMPKGSAAEKLAFLSVCSEYRLNPLLNQIYAFPGKSGGIKPMVSIDGWIAMVNRHPEYDGSSFSYEDRGGKPYAVTCKMYRKGRAHPVEVTEFLDECQRSSEPWQKTPRRMLRHRAFIQAARLAFGFGGLTDEDELVASPAPKQEPRLAEVERLTLAMDPKRAPVAAQTEQQPEPEPQAEPEAEQPAEAEVEESFEGRF